MTLVVSSISCVGNEASYEVGQPFNDLGVVREVHHEILPSADAAHVGVFSVMPRPRLRSGRCHCPFRKVPALRVAALASCRRHWAL